jgi:hypothetical protein
VDLHALGEQVGGRFVVRLLHGGEHRPGGAGDGFLALHETADHLRRVGPVVVLDDRGQRSELPVAARRRRAQRTDALGDQVDGQRSSVYCVSNMRCRVWNIGPVTFQW